MWQQHQAPSLPIPSSVSPQKSPRMGTFAARNDERHSESVATSLDDIQSRLKKISYNVVETRDEFVSLSDRSKDNGVALERLMAEIKSFVAISNTHHTNQVRELSKLGQLEQLERLQHLDKLGHHVRDLELQQRELNARMDMWKKFDDDGLFDQIKQLNTVPAKLKALEKLENLDQLKLLAGLRGAVDAFKNDRGLQTQLTTEFAELQSRMDKLTALIGRPHSATIEAKTDPSLETKLDSILAQLPKAEPVEHQTLGEIQGEVRAIQDHLLGEHDELRKEVQELRQKVQAQDSELEKFHSLHETHEKLSDKVSKLENQERQLIAHNAQLKAELEASVQGLAATESKYRQLENHVRDVMLTKYQAAVESASSVKDSEIVLPKRRQNRSVSLQTS